MNLSVGNTVDNLRKAIPFYAPNISNPYKAAGLLQGNCLALSLAAHALREGLIIVRHSISTGQLDHFFCINRDEPQYAVMDRIYTRPNSDNLDAYVERWIYMFGNKQQDLAKFYRQGSTELLRGIFTGEIEKGERVLKPDNPRPIKLRVGIVDGQKALEHVVDKEPADFSRLADFIIEANAGR